MSIKEKLNIKCFNSKDTFLSYRTLNHYDEMDLLLTHRNNNKEWRKFNSFELIWINLITSLRDIGLSLLKIKLLKHKIFNEGKHGTIDKANFVNRSFQEEILLSITEKYDLYVLVFSDCSYTFHDSISLQQWHNGIYKSEPHINIPLKGLIFDVLDKLNSKTLI